MQNLWDLTSEEWIDWKKQTSSDGLTDEEFFCRWHDGHEVKSVLKAKDPDEWTLGEVRRAKEFLENPTMSDLDLLSALNNVNPDKAFENIFVYFCANCNHSEITLHLECPSCNILWTKITFAHFEQGKYTYFCSTNTDPEIVTF